MPNSRSVPSRRTFLTSTAVAAATVGGLPLLTGCGSDGNGGSGGGRSTEEELKTLLPTYRESDVAVEPDILSKHGSSPGYTSYIPTEDLGVSVPKPRGSGGEFSAMTPLWGTPPRAGNDYWTAVDKAIGVNVKWQTQDGSTYGEKLGAVLAGSDIPDLVCVPGWELSGQIPRAISSRFADLGPYLSGDRVFDYPNLAAVPTAAWETAVFGGALRGLPMPQAKIGGVVPFYREDIFEENGWEPPTHPDDFLDFAKDITSPASKVWACEDMKWTALAIFGVIPDKPQYWTLVDGKLVNRMETDAYLEALAWTRKLYDAEVVHPDAIAVQGDSENRFTAGESLMFTTGDGVWHGLVSEQSEANPDFRMNAFDFFGADGGDPVLYAGNGANIWTFLNKNLSEERIKEALEIANFCAAPYGTVENRLRTYGIEDLHYTIEDGTPVRTEKGDVEVLPDTYVFIASPSGALAHPDQPKMVEDLTRWQKAMLPFVKEPMFYGRQIQEPDEFTNLADPFEDLEDDVVRGRASISDMQDAVSEWRRNGGDRLRDWYQELMDKEGA